MLDGGGVTHWCKYKKGDRDLLMLVKKCHYAWRLIIWDGENSYLNVSSEKVTKPGC